MNNTEATACNDTFGQAYVQTECILVTTAFLSIDNDIAASSDIMAMKVQAFYRCAHPLLVTHGTDCSRCSCLNHCFLHLHKHSIIGMERGTVKPEFSCGVDPAAALVDSLAKSCIVIKIIWVSLDHD